MEWVTISGNQTATGSHLSPLTPTLPTVETRLDLSSGQEIPDFEEGKCENILIYWDKIEHFVSSLMSLQGWNQEGYSELGNDKEDYDDDDEEEEEEEE